MHTTTLKALRQAGACYTGYNRLVRSLQGKPFTEEDKARESYIRFRHEDPITLHYILDSNGLDDALWALCACEQTPELKKKARLFTVECGRGVQRLMTDPRSINALDVAERYAHGKATDDELHAARIAARAAAWAAAAWVAVWAAADSAVDSALAAAADSALAIALDDEREWQKQLFIEMFCGE